MSLDTLLHYLGKLKIQIFCRYLADINQEALSLQMNRASTLLVKIV